MPEHRPLGRGRLIRPLLDIPRETLRGYAVEQGLEWIDDPSNFDTTLDRNYLRHTLLPELAERRSGIREVLARSAGHFAESARLLDELAQMDRQQVLNGNGTLSVAVLKALSPERCRNLLRFHIRQHGLPLPEHKHLQRVLDELLPAAEDAMPLVAWPGAEVRRYRDELYCMSPLPPVPEQPLTVPWLGEEEVCLPSGLGLLRARGKTGEGLSATKLEGMVCEVRLRQGGETIKPQGRGEHHALKKLYQEAGVPPWERDRRPLLFLNGELVHVTGYWTAAEYAAGATEEGIILDWLP
jgi:tRNA(Ile)-lysidine synthase